MPLSKDIEDTIMGFLALNTIFLPAPPMLPEAVIEIWLLLILGVIVFFLQAFFPLFTFVLYYS